MHELPNELDVAQGTAEWQSARCGIVTASRVADICKKGSKGQYYQKRHDYLLEIVAETISGQIQPHFNSEAMKYGIENEPLARAAYEERTGYDVRRPGLLMHPTIARFGASPDGIIIGQPGMSEFKIPNSTTHIEYLLAGEVPEIYTWQMHSQICCSDGYAEWNDFVSHDPRVSDKYESLATLIVRLPRNNDIISEIEHEVILFLAEVDAMIETIKGIGKGYSAIEQQLKRSLEVAK